MLHVQSCYTKERLLAAGEGQADQASGIAQETISNSQRCCGAYKVQLGFTCQGLTTSSASLELQKRYMVYGNKARESRDSTNMANMGELPCCSAILRCC